MLLRKAQTIMVKLTIIYVYSILVISYFLIESNSIYNAKFLEKTD